MKLPLSLIKSFIHLEHSPAQVSEALTLLGIEVDRIHHEHLPFSGVVVGEIKSSKKHPQADTLHIAEVSDGKTLHTVVCAAPNCRAGIKVPFAKLGAQLSEREGKIEPCTIKGVKSEGMLCSAQELQLFEEGDKILELPLSMETGHDFAPLVWDPVLEISLTPNLGHCMSALGIARELAAFYQVHLQPQRAHPQENGRALIQEKVDVHVLDPNLCPRYSCRLIEGVKIGESPFWLRRILESSGMKSINNAVDVTNYIMLKYGQPLHAFDYDKIGGKKISVGPLTKKEKFLGLDNVERELPPGTIAISNSQGPLAIGGILGGMDSSVNDNTANILLEAAYFDPMAVRVAAKKIGLRTESSQRFEKGIDPIGLKDALDEAAALLNELCGGAVTKGAIDHKKHLEPKQIRCRGDRVNHLLGTKLSLTEMEEILRRLAFHTKELGKGVLLVDVPLYRFDISEEVDLIEEIARVYGYNNIEKTTPKLTSSQIPNDPIFLFENELRQRLSALSLQEFLTCDLISPKLSEIAQEIALANTGFLQTLHSKSEEYSILRTSLLPALLNVVRKNLDQKNQNIHAFELGRIHFLQDGQPLELPMLAILLTGKSAPHHWCEKSREVDFFDLKGMIESLFHELQIPFSAESASHISFHPGRQANLPLNVGSFGEVHPSLLEKFDIKQRVFYAELSISALMKMRKRTTQTTPLPQFPASQRDLTVPLAPDTLIDSIFQTIRSAPLPLLEKVELIDLYSPEGLPQKNATLRFTYRDRLKTISFEEVEAEHARLSKLLAK